MSDYSNFTSLYGDHGHDPEFDDPAEGDMVWFWLVDNTDNMTMERRQFYARTYGRDDIVAALVRQ